MTVTPNNLKTHMRLDLTDASEDDFLQQKLDAASAWCGAFIGTPLADIAGGAPADVLEAVRQLAAHYYENREASTYADINVVPFGVISLLAAHREYSF